jgi:hypothetical protein
VTLLKWNKKKATEHRSARAYASYLSGEIMHMAVVEAAKGVEPVSVRGNLFE